MIHLLLLPFKVVGLLLKLVLFLFLAVLALALLPFVMLAGLAFLVGGLALLVRFVL